MRSAHHLSETSTRFVGWCPVCEGDFKVRSNVLVHHGYQRPGIGYIVGDCPGVGREPYELGTGAATSYLKSHILPEISQAKKDLRVLNSAEGPEWLMFERYDMQTRRVKYSFGKPETIRLTKQEADDLTAQLPAWERNRYSWEHRLRIVIAGVESRLSYWEREQRRTENLINAWPGPQPLRTVEEEIQHKEQERDEREKARTIARDQKISDEVVKLRKRIDSAVRNKNSATLADIYEGRKLREISKWALSHGDAMALLERDHVWRAFGLLTPAGVYLTGKDDDGVNKILAEMQYGRLVPRSDRGFDRVDLPWPAELGGGVAKTRGY